MENKKYRIKDTWPIIKETFGDWNDDQPFDLSSSVAYYAIFSLPALLIIIISIAGLVFGREAVEGQISKQIGSMIGKGAGKDIQDMIAKAYTNSSSIISAIIGIATLLIGSTGVFLQLQKSLNIIWNVQVKSKAGIKKLLLDRATSLGVILAIGFMLLVSLVITTGLSALSHWISSKLPDFFLYIFFVISSIFSLGVVGVLFAIIYKVLPDVIIPWKSVWVGAAVTAILFEIGRFALGLYFGKSNPASSYGAAGSVILIMLWVYYSCLILFFGAEFTKVFAKWYGLEIKPSVNAEPRNIPSNSEIRKAS